MNFDDALLKKASNSKRSLASTLSIDNEKSDGSDILPTKRRKVNVDSEWELTDLPELPFLYLKEKTSVVILNQIPQDIASRVVECAKSISAYGQYNGEKVSRE